MKKTEWNVISISLQTPQEAEAQIKKDRPDVKV